MRSISSSTRPNIVGTTMALVIPSRTIVCTHVAGSKLSRYTILRPAYVDDSTAATPAMWYGGTATSAASSSSALPSSTVEKMYVARFSCRRTAGFRPPRGAAREQQDGDRLRIDVDRDDIVGRGRGRGCSDVFEEHISLDQLDPLDRGLEPVGHTGPDDRRRRRGAGHDRAELFIRQPVVHRNEGTAGESGTEEADRHRLGVHVDQHDALPGPGIEERRCRARLRFTEDVVDNESP